MSSATLTDRQRQILELIRQRSRDTGYPPTRQEIASAFGFRSVNAVTDHLRALERKGMIALRGGASRGIRLLEPALEGLPVVGRVAAGQPILALEQIEEYRQLDPGLFRPGADFLLRVQGESMRDAGIRDGDLLAVHRTEQAQPGQIVVARLEDEVTVKRFRPDPDSAWRILLQAENPDFAPIELDLRQQSLHIEGLAVGLVRRLGDGFSTGPV